MTFWKATIRSASDPRNKCDFIAIILNHSVNKNNKKLLKILKEEGVTIVGEMQEFSYGKFGWILDPEGNKIELWEPVDDVFQKENGL